MRVAKEFRWEAAHRIPWHEGGCHSLHGHSYHMTVELEGEPDARGMVIDFKEIKAIVRPLVDEWDHSVMAHDADRELIAAVESLGSKLSVLPCDTTAENVCKIALERILDVGGARLRDLGITHIVVRVRETVTSYAEVSGAVV